MQIDLSLNSESIQKQVDVWDEAIRGRNKLQNRIDKHLKKMNR